MRAQIHKSGIGEDCPAGKSLVAYERLSKERIIKAKRDFLKKGKISAIYERLRD